MIYNILSESEKIALDKALIEYRKSVEKQKRNEVIMSKKKFNYGDVVIKKGASYADSWFGLDSGDIGIVVGHYDCAGTDGHGKDMYRVHYSESNPYVGTDVESIELYDGEIPEHLKNVEWNQIWELRVKLK